MDFTSLVVTAIVAGVSSFFGSYLKKKGENLATHEDMDKLLASVRIMTETTKEIEGRVSDTFLVKQKLRELQQEAIFKAIDQLSEVEIAMSELAGISGAMSREPNNQQLRSKRVEYHSIFHKAFREFCKAKTTVNVICAFDVQQRFANIQRAMMLIAEHSMDSNIHNPNEMFETWGNALTQLQDAIRHQLGIEQSNKSSPAPNPAAPSPQ